jgi:thioredoxin 1
MVPIVTDATFPTEVLDAQLPVLVEFGAAWCPPCRMMAPVLDAVAAERAPGLRVFTLDVDANPMTQARYGVLSMPTLMLFVEGRAVRQLVGYTAKPTLLRALDAALPSAA